MIETYRLASTLVAYSPIEIIKGESRRTCERITVSKLLKHIFNVDVDLQHDKNGAPLLDGWNISISHSQKLAVVALDPIRKIGIDVEEWRAALHRIKHKFLSPQEIEYFNEDEESLLKAWTIKEAVYKIVGKDAVEFSTSINITKDMNQVTSIGHTYNIYTLKRGESMLTLVC